MIKWLLLSLLMSWQIKAGTGVGSQFVHREYSAFDFHIAHPKKWTFTEKNVKRTYSVTKKKIWQLTNEKMAPKDKVSWVFIKFLANFPAENKAELLKEIKKIESSKIKWTGFNNEFVGYRSQDIDSDSKITRYIDYYLVARRQVIRLERLTRPEAGAPNDMLNIVNSIHRTSAGPKINYIKAKKSSYKVGDNACYLVEVDDLKGSYDDQGVSGFEVEGHLDHWRFWNAKWDPSKNWFVVCTKVSERFGPYGLVVQRITVQNVRGQETSCWINSNSEFICNNKVTKSAMAKVENKNIDRSGPIVTVSNFDPKNQTLSLNASDDVAVVGGTLIFQSDHAGNDENGTARLIVYPDQFDQSDKIDLSTINLNGWVQIKKIIAYDKNGNPSMLSIPDVKCKNQFTPENGYYLRLHSDGRCSSTKIKIMTYIRH